MVVRRFSAERVTFLLRKFARLRPSFVWLMSLPTLSCATAFADSRYNLTPGVTPISHDIFYLHMTIFWICVAIGIVVFGVMGYSLFKFRKSRGVTPSKVHGSIKLEIIWIVIPLLILIGLAIPATVVLLRTFDDSKSTLTIKVTGYQWKWKYEYLNYGISFFSNMSTPLTEIHNKKKKNAWYLLEVDNPLVVPIHQKIRFLITSNDVIHSWWVPKLGIKRDAIPGFINEAWARINKPGTYRGQCAELCGMNHGFMPIVVEAKSAEGFKQWVAKHRGESVPGTRTAAADGTQVKAKPKTLTYDELMKLGKAKYELYCAACHKADGRGMPPTFPGLRGSSVATGKPISRHIDIILHGIKGTTMQAFDEQLNDEDIAAITTYERNAWGNDTGDIVQPADVAKRRAADK